MGAATKQDDRQIFEAIAQRISKITGVQLGDKQYSLVLSRLSKHLRNMGGLTPSQYWDYLQTNEDDEIPVLISLLTTHHTFFFREQVHFDHLEQILPDLVAAAQAQGKKTLKVWCAACSKGQEGYTLAMFLDYHLKQLRVDMNYEILFSDVDAASVKWAENGVYGNDELSRVPITYRSNHWIRGKGEISDFSKVRKNLKEKCKFKTINLLELAKENFTQKFDLVFCRNVFIYFTVKEIESISKNILKNMEEHGQFVIGVSESLMGATLPVDHLGKSIYKKCKEAHFVDVKDIKRLVNIKADEPSSKSIKRNSSEKSTRDRLASKTGIKQVATARKNPDLAPAAATSSKAFNVITLQPSLKLSSELRTAISRFPECKSVGFDVVTSADEAIRKINDKGADILVLEASGINYLQKILKETTAKVIIAATSGDDQKLISQGLDLGAHDFISLKGRHLGERETKTLHEKLVSLGNTASRTLNSSPSTGGSDIDPDCIIGIGASTGGTEAITKVLMKLPSQVPPIVIVQHIPEFYSKQFADRLNSTCQFEVREAKDGDVLQPNLALIAPGNYQMKVVFRGGKYKVHVFDGEKVSGHKPSVDVMFHSLAECKDRNIHGVILTGMGSDGAKGLLKMRQAGAKTVAQDEASCVVYGMPKVANEIGACNLVLPLDQIADHLIKAFKKKSKR